MRLRHALVVFAVLPMLFFAALPVAPMSSAFDGPALTVAWGPSA